MSTPSWIVSTIPAAVILLFASVMLGAEARRYEPNWASLDSRPVPQWYRDAKFGIFIHWGVYSVPSWGPKGKYAEWYWHDMQDKKGETRQFHERVYGKNFPYQEFATMFRAELFKPEQWADVFARSGAKYVVLTSKHHEGFCLWKNEQANQSWKRPWNSVDIGPKRDLLGDLGQAVRARGLKMGFYYSLYEWYNPLYQSHFDQFRDQHFFPQFKDVVSKYKPAIIFADGEWEHTSAEWKSPELLAWLYNDSDCGDDLVINDRWGKDTRGHHGGYYTTEYGGATDWQVNAMHAWEESRGIGASYGYNRNEDYDDYRSAGSLIHLLIEMASQGGNLLLDIGPTADGRIPVIMQERLIEMGNWLKANGESIYGTTAGPFPRPPKGQPLHWTATAKPGKLYIHVLDWPKKNELLLPELTSTVKKASFLAGATSIETASAAQGVTLKLPTAAPDARATVIVLDLDGDPSVHASPKH